ncbi:hypothetical protein NXW18_08370 [Bacteroides thetaiotaomicron]|nr:hypothetical protein [Bacteroides thetaiotaomicron]MCS2713555.1 hypothetical protein [Bacteroides thetaiotaomicron]MCS2873750.1 hypothetical protein [Bacteroides thetaiotaomicron]
MNQFYYCIYGMKSSDLHWFYNNSWMYVANETNRVLLACIDD